MPKLKIDLVVDGFREMDVDILDILLDDDKTYMSAKKETFLKKLNDAFEEFRASGDTALIPYRGHCRESRCPNNGCAGFSFVGNHSKRNLDFIFDELGNEIEDIQCCTRFETNDEVGEKMDAVIIEIKNDEKAGFIVTEEFLTRKQNSKLAYDELLKYQNTIIDKSIYIPWLNKYKELYNDLLQGSKNYDHINEFFWLYFRINQIEEFLQTRYFAIEALEKYALIDQNNEASIIQWLDAYDIEDGHYDVYSILGEHDLDHPENIEYIKAKDLRIDASDYIPVIEFKILHCDLASQTDREMQSMKKEVI